MRQIVYKVVNLDYEDNRMYSAITTAYNLEYIIGKVIRPKIGRIFVFNNLEDARHFCDCVYRPRILECECKKFFEVRNLVNLPWRQNVLNIERDFVMYWAGRKGIASKLMGPPNGTVSVRCLKVNKVVE